MEVRLMAIGLAFIYFLPSIIAMFRGHEKFLAIFALNLFTGASGIGWIGSLVWALTNTQRKENDLYNKNSSIKVVHR